MVKNSFHIAPFLCCPLVLLYSPSELENLKFRQSTTLDYSDQEVPQNICWILLEGAGGIFLMDIASYLLLLLVYFLRTDNLPSQQDIPLLIVLTYLTSDKPHLEVHRRLIDLQLRNSLRMPSVTD